MASLFRSGHGGARGEGAGSLPFGQREHRHDGLPGRRGGGLIPGTDVRLREVGAAAPDDVYRCDGLAVGSPTNMGALSWRMKRFWDEAVLAHWGKVDGKVACAFSSSGGWGGGAEIACQSLLMVLMNFGFLVFGPTDYAGTTTTCHYGAIAAREPGDAEVADGCRNHSW